jgi:uncharacterized membrane protein YccC
MAAARAAEYRLLARACRAAPGDGEDAARALRRLRGEFRAITRRDFFPPRERQEAATALRELETALAPAREPAR